MQDDSPERLKTSLEALNVRIARLAIGLGIDLNDHQRVAELMAQAPRPRVTVERRLNIGGSRRAPGDAGGERRVSHLQEEFRGLVTLRYHIEALSVAENGVTATSEMLVRAHQHLVEQGFTEGADGLTAQAWRDLPEPPKK